jgi:hypothetical protein
MQEKNACNNWEKNNGNNATTLLSIHIQKYKVVLCVREKKMAQLHAKTQDVQQS